MDFVCLMYTTLLCFKFCYNHICFILCWKCCSPGISLGPTRLGRKSLSNWIKHFQMKAGGSWSHIKDIWVRFSQRDCNTYLPCFMFNFPQAFVLLHSPVGYLSYFFTNDSEDISAARIYQLRLFTSIKNPTSTVLRESYRKCWFIQQKSSGYRLVSGKAWFRGSSAITKTHFSPSGDSASFPSIHWLESQTSQGGRALAMAYYFLNSKSCESNQKETWDIDRSYQKVTSSLFLFSIP